MNKEQKVTSLKLSKKIHDKAKEKGFELPESEYYRLAVEDKYNKASEIVNFSRENRSGKYSDGTEWSEKFYKAYDIAELGEMLPRNIKIECGICTVKEWRVILFEKNLNEHSEDFMRNKITKVMDDTEFAEAMGKMFYYLLDNDLL